MRNIPRILAAAVATGLAVLWSPVSQAAFFSLPRLLTYQIKLVGAETRIRLGQPTLAPIGHTQFCLEYSDDCAVHGVDFRRRQIALTPERWNELNNINREVNRDIVPEVTPGTDATDRWVISPAAGDCKDYAITKRHELLAKGWPSRALLLSEVVVPWGEHHLVLVVRTKDVDVVLDNLTTIIRPVAMTYREYKWIRIETPQNPKFWARVQMPNSMQSAMLTD